MISWKNKVVAKISRLFADSQSQSQADARSDSNPNQETSACTEESYPTKRSGISSFFVFFLPTTCSGNDGSNRTTRPLPSLHPLRRWIMHSFSSKDKPLDCSKDIRTVRESNGVDEIPKESIENAPQRNNGCDGVEVACSTLKHGISLQTLLRRSADLPGPCLLIAGDVQGAIFGGLLDAPLNPSPKRKYQGTSQTFVFTTIYGGPRLFRATGANRFYYLCMNNLLAFGGGSSFALCLEEDLLYGTSGPSETFGNLCLSHSPEFELKNVELWGFTYSSPYLT